MSKQSSTIPFIKLDTYIPAKHFRTIPQDTDKKPHGITEVQVLFEFEKGSVFYKDVLPNLFRDHMFVYGYVHENPNLKRVFSGMMAADYPQRHIMLHEWDDRFMIVFENGTRTKEITNFVTKEEVIYLFQNCLHPNE